MNDIQIMALGPGDAAVLDQVTDEVFDNPVDSAQTRAFLDTENHKIYVARDGDLVIGMATGVIMLHPDKPPQLFIQEVGVDPKWQRRGIGRRLTQALLEFAQDNGCTVAWLGTEHDNVPARALYARLKPTEEDSFVMYSYDLPGAGE